MQRFMLDTDTCSCIMKRSHPLVVKRPQAMPVTDVCMSNEITLATSLRTRADLTPERFDVKGKTSLTEVNISVDVNDRVAHVVDGTQKSQVSAPERFFTLGGAFPISAQMMLFRYLAAHNPGAPLKAFPIGDVRFERRGQDIVEVGGRTVPLDHYAVSGVIWGRESVWIDDRQQIIAAITYAPSLEPIQAIREGNRRCRRFSREPRKTASPILLVSRAS